MFIVHRPADPAKRGEAILTVMQDDRLNLAARGLLGMLLSHPDETWPHINFEELALALYRRQKALTGDSADGRARVRQALFDIEGAGYIVRRKGGQGVFPEAIIEVFHSPSDIESQSLPMERDSNCLVYAIQQVGTSLVKIGTTGDLQKRLRGLQSAHPLALEVVCSHSGGYELEQYLHDCFARRRVRGEWFDFEGTDPQIEVAEAIWRKFPEEADPNWPVPRIARTITPQG